MTNRNKIQLKIGNMKHKVQGQISVRGMNPIPSIEDKKPSATQLVLAKSNIVKRKKSGHTNHTMRCLKNQ